MSNQKLTIADIKLLNSKIYNKEHIQMILSDASSNAPSVSVKSMGTVIGLCKSHEFIREATLILLNIAKDIIDNDDNYGHVDSKSRIVVRELNKFFRG